MNRAGAWEVVADEHSDGETFPDSPASGMSGRTQGVYVSHRASQASEADREQPPIVLGPPPPTPV
eukprot:3046600-Alexandrium_andersonii.AAC.1